MAISDDDMGLEQLLQQVKRLIPHPKTQETQEIPSAAEGYQAPIKGSFYNSGAFSGAPSPRHPQGHAGVDLRAAGGTTIYPIAPGVVTNVGTNPKGGNVVNIQHANGVRSYYAHMGSARVQRGQHVNNNTVIGTVGDSGNAKGTWPHLHIQVWKDNRIQDPAQYFAVPKYTAPGMEEKQQGQWLSARHKQEADSFDMRQHVATRQAEFSRKVDGIVRLANVYSRVCH